MNAVIAERIESMHKMLVKTREELKTLNGNVMNLQYMVGGVGLDGSPPPLNQPQVNEDGEDENYKLLSSKCIEVCSCELKEILCVSNGTLKRWRSERSVNFKYVSANHVTYRLVDIYQGFLDGTLRCRGLNSLDAIERIMTYAKNVSKIRS